MHELALAQGMLDIASEELGRHGCTRLTLLRVRVGAISGVVCESLSFAFQALLAGTPSEGAVLDIVRIPLRLRCGTCGTEFAGESCAGELSPCPGCGEMLGHSVLQGKEMQVVWVEGE